MLFSRRSRAKNTRLRVIVLAIEAVIDGRVARPPRESWRRFEMETVLDQYLDVLLGGGRSPGTVAGDGGPVIRDDGRGQRLEAYD